MMLHSGIPLVDISSYCLSKGQSCKLGWVILPKAILNRKNWENGDGTVKLSVFTTLPLLNSGTTLATFHLAGTWPDIREVAISKVVDAATISTESIKRRKKGRAGMLPSPLALPALKPVNGVLANDWESSSNLKAEWGKIKGYFVFGLCTLCVVG